MQNLKMSRRPTLEGSLTKWTNVMKGWQHRWFVLDENAGVLSYYTTREKMFRGVRRGCVRLKGAILGIDDEDDANFTITTDTKTFHFQARDASEREVWVRALEDTILRHAPFPHDHPVQPIVVLRKHMPHHLLKVHFEADEGSHESNMRRFDCRISQSDVLLQVLIEQTARLEARAAELDDAELRTRLERMAKNYKQMLDAVKLAIVLLQILKNTIDPVHGIGLVARQSKSKNRFTNSGSQLYGARTGPEGVIPGPSSSAQQGNGSNIELGSECQEGRARPGVIDVARGEGMTLIVSPEIVPETSYSSSDDDDFFDAEELQSPGPRPDTPVYVNLSGGARGSLPRKGSDATETASKKSRDVVPPKNNDGTLDYDALYEEENAQDDISMENNGSLITHLLSQVKIGMDLTKVVLPTFILETRSLLEMYADYFAHPDIFVSIADGQTARDRMVRVVRWYVSAYHAGRKSGVAKKPYNPILGEVFQCHWDVPGIERTTEVVSDGPVPWCTSDQLTFVGEQVSHHPPVSAFYAEHLGKRISFNGFVYTKSKFLGLSVGVHNLGHGIVSVLDHGEQYKVTFPSGYGRSILTVPWIELGGTVAITCQQTAYQAKVEFLMKPFYGGKRHQICAEIFAPGEKKPFQTVTGEWNGAMHVSYAKTGRSEVFVDVNQIPPVKKLVRKIVEQDVNESRRLWKEVTAGLRLNDIEKATNSKTLLEQKQRDEAKTRKEQAAEWETKLFFDENGEWAYKAPLVDRLKEKGAATQSSHH